MKGLISNIFAIERQNERDDISSWDKNGNKMLLWHGTSAQNIVGILQTGFRIAPPDSNHTGSMFGQGVYFADMFSKSIGYTNRRYYGYGHDKKKKPEKLYMLLCEVALGKMKEYTQSTEPPKNIPSKKFQSVKGLGRTGPDMAKSIYLQNGCVIPLGSIINYPTNPNTWHSLNHNEYVVYNTQQVRIKYIVELRDTASSHY